MRKRLLPLLMLFFFCIPASPGQGSVSGQSPKYEDDFFLNYEFSAPVFSQVTSVSKGVSVTADAAVLMDVDTGQVLYAKNPDQPRPIASTTKIMTALLAIEFGDLKGMVMVSPRAAGVGESSIHLEAGERLMGSRNDIVVTVPIKEGGTVEKIVQMGREFGAPVKSGLPVGRLLVVIEGSPVAETKLVTLDDTDRLSVPRLVYNRIRDSMD